MKKISYAIFQFIISAAAIIIPVFFSFGARAFVMSSANYKMEQDSVNFGGTENAASENYRLRDTLGEIATGTSSSESYLMASGYRMMDETYLAMTVAGAVSMSPDIGAPDRVQSNGSGVWNVKTDSAAGYTLSVRAAESPALRYADYFFADYSPALSGTPDYSWNPGAASEFGYSVYNQESQPSKFMDNGANCSAGAGVTDGVCWYGFSTADEIVAYKTSRTEPAGEDTKINFRAEIKGRQQNGFYAARLTATAVNN